LPPRKTRFVLRRDGRPGLAEGRESPDEAPALRNTARNSVERALLAVVGRRDRGASFLYVWRYLSPLPGPTFSSVLQGALRPNTYVSVAASTALYGQDGLTATALAGQGPLDRRGLVKALVSTPVILSVVAGGITNLSGFVLPDAIFSTLKILGSASLPLGLLAVGAGLDVAAARVSFGPVIQSSLVKLAFVPLATYFIGMELGLRDVPLDAAVMFNSLPCTPSAYIMARLLGGDHRMSAGIISVQTTLAALTMPLVLVALAWG